ncbi:hypothetical protein K501DRAFT_316011 [Backusella circina FSU 941]|nr:hypothetical protein K501DRAFT_316011 [Backusella circina FSU 941]
MIHADYYISNDNEYYFSNHEWKALDAAALTAGSVSILFSLFVLILHSFIVIKKDSSANRLSIRMIIIACVCNIVYCTLQIVSCQIHSEVYACHILVHLIMATDTMACVALAMIGFNLVVIFIFKVSKRIKVDLCYYGVVLLSGILTFSIPLVLHVKKEPTKVPMSYCWYHYYFEGRMNGLFNWMWYYGWLLLSLTFATLCAAVSIRYVVKKQEDLADTLDMFAQREKALEPVYYLRRYTSANNSVFLKIARRCVCYPLIPLMSKVWGVSISISSIKQVNIPFSIFILDLVFSCLLGFMVTCVYLSDPAILNFIREIKYQIKKKYMYDYFSVRYQPGFNPDSTPSREYPHILKLVPLKEDVSESYKSAIRSSLINEEASINFIYHPNIELKQIRGISAADYNRNSTHQQRYSIMTITSKTGGVYLPNEVYDFDSLTTSRSHFIPMRLTLDRKKVQMMPAKSLVLNQPESSTRGARAQHTEMIETLVVYEHPCLAKFIHWVLASIFRVKPLMGDEEGEEYNKRKKHEKNPAIATTIPKRVFRDFTNSSNPSVYIDSLDSILTKGQEEQQEISNQIPPPSLPTTDDIAEMLNEITSSGSKLKMENSGQSNSDTIEKPVVNDHQLGTSSSFFQQQELSYLGVPTGSSVSVSDNLKTSLPPASENGKKKKKTKIQDQTLHLFDKPIDIKVTESLETDNSFPMQLSPPPKSHYRQQSRIKIKQLYPGTATGETSEGDTPDEQSQKDSDERDDIDDGKLKKEQDDDKSTSHILFDDFGFARTTLEYVHNWEDGRERCEVTRGDWDIEQEIQKQIELEKKITHDM